MKRRRFLTLAGASGALLAAPQLLSACGGDDDAPAKTTPALSAAPSNSSVVAKPQGSGEKIKIGFIALTDCGSCVMAEKLGIFKEYGLQVELVKQASWAANFGGPRLRRRTGSPIARRTVRRT